MRDYRFHPKLEKTLHFSDILHRTCLWTANKLSVGINDFKNWPAKNDCSIISCLCKRKYL